MRVRAALGRTLLLAGLALAVAAPTPGCNRPRPQRGVLSESDILPPLTPEEADEVGRWVADVHAGEAKARDAPRVLRKGRGAAYVALRARGRLLAEAWGPEGDLDESVFGALEQARAKATGPADTVELDLAHSFHEIEHPTIKNIRSQVSNRSLGIRGLELALGDDSQRWAPSEMIAENLKVRHAISEFWGRIDVEEQQFVERGGVARWFEAQQLLITLSGGQTRQLVRGNQFVDPTEVSQANTRAATELMRAWMLHHLHDNGRMTYLWFPSTGTESRDNNMIRQWMATNALIAVAQREDDPVLWGRIADNIDYNLRRFYRQEGEFGVIQYNETVKLGSLALAALAISNHPERERWREQEHSLRRTIMSLWHESGEFTLFYRPRHQQQNAANFYPGETLLLWARLYEESRDPELLRRWVASYRFYRAWHLNPDHRKPSFVPWHTQASVRLWKVLGEASPEGDDDGPPDGLPDGLPDGPDVGPPLRERTPEGWAVGTRPETPVDFDRAELVEWVFDMNDWLIDEMEVWEEALYQDEKGRFHSRERRFGIPHASATGVYMEGLVDAYVLAEAVGDDEHAERYRRSLSRALRSVAQLQFVDDVDLFYVVDREAVRGGLRTSIFHNDIRVDNVQHVLMATLRIQEVFGPDDYATD